MLVLVREEWGRIDHDLRLRRRRSVLRRLVA